MFVHKHAFFVYFHIHPEDFFNLSDQRIINKDNPNIS